jgi:hypothetical protein
LRVSMTLPTGTRAIASVRECQEEHIPRRSRGDRRKTIRDAPCARSQNDFFCPGNPAHAGVLPDLTFRSLGRITPLNSNASEAFLASASAIMSSELVDAVSSRPACCVSD